VNAAGRSLAKKRLHPVNVGAAVLRPAEIIEEPARCRRPGREIERLDPVRAEEEIIPVARDIGRAGRRAGELTSGPRLTPSLQRSSLSRKKTK